MLFRSAARSLIDFWLSPQSEARLAAGDSGQFPLNSEVQERSRVQPDEPVQWMQADFAAAASKWEEARQLLAEIFHGE